MCVCAGECHLWGVACRGQRRASDPLEPELQVFRDAQHRCWQLFWGLLQEVL